MRYACICLVITFISCTSDTRTIKIKGSDTEVNLTVHLAETFYRANSTVFVSVSGGGSGLGIASLLNGTADIANSSRSIKGEELELFSTLDTPIDSFIFAQDAIAFVVADDLPLDSILTDDLAKILNGEYTNWSQLTQEERPINIYGRQSNSGTHDFVRSKLGIEFTPYAKQMNGNAQILEAIKSDHTGIGYVGAGYVSSKTAGLKILRIHSQAGESAISPFDAQMIASAKYFFQRPLFQYYKASSYDKVKPFLDFEKGPSGMKIIKSSGYYPVN